MKHLAILLLAFTCLFSNINAQINKGELIISDFENLELDPDSYWNGSDETGEFISGGLVFPNNYNPDWFSWDGWAYSNMANDTTPGFMNQYSAITAAGYSSFSSGGSTYGISYIPSDWITNERIPVTIYFADDEAHIVEGFYVTNSTFAALSMEYGDDYSKKFGGESGDDPDWFKLSVWGFVESNETDTIDFYLADYRYENNDEDYFVKTWEWVDLSPLGIIDSLKFTLNSSDVGMFGMNTPSYFCVDNVSVVTIDTTGIDDGTLSPESLRISPNPSDGLIRLSPPLAQPCNIEIFDLSGRRIYHNEYYIPESEIDLKGINKGCYIIKVQQNNHLLSGKLIIR